MVTACNLAAGRLQFIIRSQAAGNGPVDDKAGGMEGEEPRAPSERCCNQTSKPGRAHRPRQPRRSGQQHTGPLRCCRGASTRRILGQVVSVARSERMAALLSSSIATNQQWPALAPHWRLSWEEGSEKAASVLARSRPARQPEQLVGGFHSHSHRAFTWPLLWPQYGWDATEVQAGPDRRGAAFPEGGSLLPEER